MNHFSCGIDFGTSNSSVAVANHQGISLVPVEGDSVTIPSALFYPADASGVLFGRRAINTFLSRTEGRFMRSLKRVLGSSAMKQGTLVNGKVLKFDRIISSFLNNLRASTTAFSGQEIDNVVLGRPVHFVDNDPAADAAAQDELSAIAKLVGFKNVEFQFEPIAAAFAHEVNVVGEKLALVADIGGGTSDFSVIRLSSKYVGKTDRSSDILANTGVRVGGNDFDKDLSLAVILPELGYLTTYGDKQLEVPLKYFHDLSEWSKVNFLYIPKVLSQVRQFLHESHDKKKLARLLNVLEQESGHAVLAAAEDTKIALTHDPTYTADFNFVEKGFSINIARQVFEHSIEREIGKMATSVTECISKAGVRLSSIELVILTGGSTEVPLVQRCFRDLFPQAEFTDENKLSSVGLGLAYDSQKRFS